MCVLLKCFIQYIKYLYSPAVTTNPSGHVFPSPPQILPYGHPLEINQGEHRVVIARN